MAQKEYLKMADVFPSEMRVGGDSDNLIIDDVGIIIGCYSGDKMAEHVLHAINSHDELVAEVERLIGENEALMKCRMAAREFFNRTVASGRLVEISSSNKHAIDEANKASDWLESELKETAGFVNK